MFIDLFISFVGSIFNFQPFIYFSSVLLALCCILLIRSFKVW